MPSIIAVDNNCKISFFINDKIIISGANVPNVFHKCVLDNAKIVDKLEKNGINENHIIYVTLYICIIKMFLLKRMWKKRNY